VPLGKKKTLKLLCTLPFVCGMMYAAWTTYDLATTRPRMGVVAFKTGRAGARAYLKYTSAPPEVFFGRGTGRGGHCEIQHPNDACGPTPQPPGVIASPHLGSQVDELVRTLERLRECLEARSMGAARSRSDATTNMRHGARCL